MRPVYCAGARSQDALVNDFQVQLKAKDEEYVKALKQQAEDVEELLERMRTEFKELQVLVLKTHGVAPDMVLFRSSTLRT